MDLDPRDNNGRTRFICTIGPQLMDVGRLAELHNCGMNLARVNGSHGSLDDVRRMVLFLKSALPQGVQILLDLPGNKVRTDNIKEPIPLEPGAEFTLKPENLTFRALYARVKAGDRISAADGAIQLDVLRVEGQDIITRVVVGGKLANRKGINIRGIGETMPFDFERDIALMNIAIECRVDFIGLSFVRSGEQVRRTKAQLMGTGVGIVAKVETAEAVAKLDRVLMSSDMIMIDRGDLEADIGRENVPLVAKRVLRRAHQLRVPVIVASQFLTTMMERPLPVMAEVSDISNAILDGADVLMLSEETAIGRYPNEAIATMRHVARTVERWQDSEYRAVILAAGPSTGFGSLTTNKHKCMLDVGGTTIIMHQIDNLRKCGIPDDRISVVIGHNHHQIETYLRGEGFLGHFVFNPWFATTNMLTSLWLARETGNLIVVYGDIIFDRGILADLLATPARAALVVDHDSELGPEDEKVIVKDGAVVQASKELDPSRCHGEFIGLARFERSAAQLLQEAMDQVMRSSDPMAFLTVALEKLAAQGIALTEVPTQGRAWNDNDCLSDLDRSRESVYCRILEANARRGDPVPR
jgi:pyruvate kinase